mmetsp:Transcript_20674/g.79329  ORF Transcript_20674/g.79329 Transcript_20674/m.79329 type:complete len:391 (+) Transcript_20674:197-1369(+)
MTMAVASRSELQNSGSAPSFRACRRWDRSSAPPVRDMSPSPPWPLLPSMNSRRPRDRPTTMMRVRPASAAVCLRCACGAAAPASPGAAEASSGPAACAWARLRRPAAGDPPSKRALSASEAAALLAGSAARITSHSLSTAAAAERSRPVTPRMSSTSHSRTGKLSPPVPAGSPVAGVPSPAGHGQRHTARSLLAGVPEAEAGSFGVAASPDAAAAAAAGEAAAAASSALGPGSAPTAGSPVASVLVPPPPPTAALALVAKPAPAASPSAAWPAPSSPKCSQRPGMHSAAMLDTGLRGMPSRRSCTRQTRAAAAPKSSCPTSTTTSVAVVPSSSAYDSRIAARSALHRQCCMRVRPAPATRPGRKPTSAVPTRVTSTTKMSPEAPPPAASA